MSALQLWLQNHNRRLTQDAIDEALMEYITHVEKQRDELLVKVAAWEQKAANWMASPEAAQRLDGYRDLAQRLNIVEQQRDELLAALRGLAASCDTGERGPDGRQHGTRMPDRCFVQAGHDAIASVKEE